MHSLFISNRTRIVLKEINFVLLLHAVDRDEFRKGGTFPYGDDTDVSQEQNKCCSMRWIDLFMELVLRQILKIDSADHLFLRKKKKQARGTHQKSRLVACHLPVFYYSLFSTYDRFHVCTCWPVSRFLGVIRHTRGFSSRLVAFHLFLL